MKGNDEPTTGMEEAKRAVLAKHPHAFEDGHGIWSHGAQTRILGEDWLAAASTLPPEPLVAPVAVPDGGEQEYDPTDLCVHGFWECFECGHNAPPAHLEGTGEQTDALLQSVRDWRASVERALGRPAPPAPESGGGEPMRGNSSLTTEDMEKLQRAQFWCDSYVSHRSGKESLPDISEAKAAAELIRSVLRSAGVPECIMAPTAPDSAGELPALDITGEDTAKAEAEVTMLLGLDREELRAQFRTVAEEFNCRERQLRTALRDLADTRKRLEEALRRLGPLAEGDVSGLSGDGLSYVICSRADSNRIREGLHALGIDPELREYIRSERKRAETAETALSAAEAKLAAAEGQRDALLACMNRYGITGPTPLTAAMELAGIAYDKAHTRYILATGKEPADA